MNNAGLPPLYGAARPAYQHQSVLSNSTMSMSHSMAGFGWGMDRSLPKPSPARVPAAQNATQLGQFLGTYGSAAQKRLMMAARVQQQPALLPGQTRMAPQLALTLAPARVPAAAASANFGSVAVANSRQQQPHFGVTSTSLLGNTNGAAQSLTVRHANQTAAMNMQLSSSMALSAGGGQSPVAAGASLVTQQQLIDVAALAASKVTPSMAATVGRKRKRPHRPAGPPPNALQQQQYYALQATSSFATGVASPTRRPLPPGAPPALQLALGVQTGLATPTPATGRGRGFPQWTEPQRTTSAGGFSTGSAQFRAETPGIELEIGARAAPPSRGGGRGGLSRLRLRCSFDVDGKCGHAIATRQCFGCKPYDAKGTGYICETCWPKRHPWYRVAHDFMFVFQRPPTPTKEQAKHAVQQELTVSTMALLGATRKSDASLGQPIAQSAAGKALAAGTRKADELLERMAFMILQLRDDEYSKRSRAAIQIQRGFRRRRGRKFARKMLKLMWGKVYDEATQRYYFVSRANPDRKTWEQPRIFGELVEVDNYPRVLASQLSDEDAAVMLQRAWRRRKTTHMLESLSLSMYRRVLDKLSGRVYYINMMTRMTQWNKPIFLGVKEPELYRVLEDDFATQQAATLVQSHIRRLKARRLFLKMVADTYERVWDPNSNRHFYFCKKTGESTWNKPMKQVLKNFDIPEAPPDLPAADDAKSTASGPSATTAVASGTTDDVPGAESGSLAAAAEKQMREFEAARAERHKEAMSKDAAIGVLGGLFKVWRARKALADRIVKVWQRVFDKDYAAYYYYNTATGESTWYKPRILRLFNIELPIAADVDDDDDDEEEGDGDDGEDDGQGTARTVDDGALLPTTASATAAGKVPALQRSATAGSANEGGGSDVFYTARENVLEDDHDRGLKSGAAASAQGRGSGKLRHHGSASSAGSNLEQPTQLTDEDAEAAGITTPIAASTSNLAPSSSITGITHRDATATADASGITKPLVAARRGSAMSTATTATAKQAKTVTLGPADALKMHFNRLLAYCHHALAGRYSREDAAKRFKKYGTRIWSLLEKRHPGTTSQYTVGLPFLSSPFLHPGKAVDLIAGNYGHDAKNEVDVAYLKAVGSKKTAAQQQASVDPEDDDDNDDDGRSRRLSTAASISSLSALE